MNQPLQITLADAASFLQSQGVPYALVGGLAASLRGQPRVTADVDIVISADVDRALELVVALEDSNFRPLFDNVSDVVKQSFLLPLRHRTANIKVDIAVGLSGFERQTVARAEPVELAGATIFVATAEDLLIMKVLAGRPQDEQDLTGIVMAQGAALDWAYCLGVAADLGKAIDQDLVSRVRSLRQSLDIE